MKSTDGAVWSTWWEADSNCQPWFLIHPEIKIQSGGSVSALGRDQHLDRLGAGTGGTMR